MNNILFRVTNISQTIDKISGKQVHEATAEVWAGGHNRGTCNFRMTAGSTDANVENAVSAAMSKLKIQNFVSDINTCSVSISNKTK